MSIQRSKFINKYGLPLPPSAGAALTENVGRYLSELVSCELCNSKSPIRYAEDGSCYGCAVREFKATLFALKNDPSGEDHKVPTSPAEALEYGLDYWFTGKACDKAPHPEKRSLDSSKCVSCEGSNPRQAAIAKGAKTYTPDKPCKRCGQRAEKRVDNGRCHGCTPATDKTHAPSAELMAECPDIVLTRSEGASLGFKVFRTGLACKRGHTGFRYVSTGGCLGCKS